MVAPLVWLLVFDFVVALVYAVVSWFGVAIEPTLHRIMIGLILLINLVVIIVWLLGLLGLAPSGLLQGPDYRR